MNGIIYIENRGRAGILRSGQPLRHYTMTPASQKRLWRICRDLWHAGRMDAHPMNSMTAFVTRPQ